MQVETTKKNVFQLLKKVPFVLLLETSFFAGSFLVTTLASEKATANDQNAEIIFFLWYSIRSKVCRRQGVLNIPSYRQKNKNGKIKICERRNFNERVWTSLSSIFSQKQIFLSRPKKFVLRNIPRERWLNSVEWFFPFIWHRLFIEERNWSGSALLLCVGCCQRQNRVDTIMWRVYSVFMWSECDDDWK